MPDWAGAVVMVPWQRLVRKAAARLALQSKVFDGSFREIGEQYFQKLEAEEAAQRERDEASGRGAVWSEQKWVRLSYRRRVWSDDAFVESRVSASECQPASECEECW